MPEYGRGVPASVFEGRVLDFSGLPEVTRMPTAHGFCLAFRRRALKEVGLLDLAYGRGYHEENDWCQRARAAGWQVGRANRVLVFHEGSVSFGADAQARADAVNLWRLTGRWPKYLEETRAFDASEASRLAATHVTCQLAT